MNEWFLFLWLLGFLFTIGFLLAYNENGFINAVYMVLVSVIIWPTLIGYAVSKYMYVIIKGLEILIRVLKNVKDT